MLKLLDFRWFCSQQCEVEWGDTTVLCDWSFSPHLPLCNPETAECCSY